MKVKQLTKRNIDFDRKTLIPSDPENRGVGGLFVKGNQTCYLGGRPKGSKDKINVLRDILLDTLLQSNGKPAKVVQAIEYCLIHKPEQLLTLAAKLIPNTLELDVTPDYAPVILDGSVIEKASTDKIEASEGEVKLIE